ncbi:ferritin-like domain-containing protein [Zavarzinia sp.]|uniref:ferritin-like domain-containing protein n=1 Tax=Zavarzinia sp. TaxID=2027920 RepID=UPI0035616D45
MSIEIQPESRPNFSRRGLIRTATLSAAAVALLGGAERRAFALDASAGDADILNVALGLEHEAIAAYQIGAESKLLKPDVLKVAVAFQSHHKEHRDALAATIKKLGGTPVEAKAQADYAKALNAGALKDQAGVVGLAIKLELGAANAYLGVIPSFQDKGLAQIAGRLAADETMHWTALTGAAGGALPAKALSFGA